MHFREWFIIKEERYGIKEKTGNRNERYFTQGDGNPKLCDEHDSRDIRHIWIFFYRNSCVEHIENLCSKQGGENEKLIFKILKRGEKLKLEEAKEEADLVDSGLRYDLTVPLSNIILIMQMSFLLLLKPFRWGMCGEQTARREDVSASLCSAILIF